ncbi:MAG: hypothetical protein WAR76_00120, partial [Xanthobacteraceae bacterium]
EMRRGCPLSGVNRTSQIKAAMSAFDPKQTPSLPRHLSVQPSINRHLRFPLVPMGKAKSRSALMIKTAQFSN